MDAEDPFFSPSLPPEFQSPEWEIINGSNSNHKEDEDFSVFPPSHHENLHLHLHLHQQEEETRFTQIKLVDVNEDEETGQQKISKFGVTRDVVKMKLKLGFEIIASKIYCVFNLVRFRRGKKLFGSVAGVTVAMVVCLWYFKWRRWRKLGSGDDRIDRIMVLVQGQDERISQLLNQISYLNDLLSARHSIPVTRSG